MEFILTLIGLAFFYWAIGWVIGAIGGTLKAAGKTAFGKGSFKDNLESEFKGMGNFRIRATKEKLKDTDLDVLNIECRGLMPINSSAQGALVTSIHTKDGEDLSPIITLHDAVKEPDSYAFQQIQPLGQIEPNTGWNNWVNIAYIPLDFIQPARGGDRVIQIITRLIDIDNPPSINLGFGEQGLAAVVTNYEHHFEGKGYLEADEDVKKSRAISVKIGMAVAMADGTLDDSEGNTLKDWIKSKIEIFGESEQKELKKLYNDAMKESHNLAKSGDLSLGELCKQMNDIAEMPQKLEAMELAYKVMGADGVIDKSEMEVINKVAKALDIDSDELEKLRDQEIVSVTNATSEINIEELLDIDPSWSDKEIKAHLAKEFQKWNNRLNALDEGDERERAQQMLDYVAEARKKYG